MEDLPIVIVSYSQWLSHDQMAWFVFRLHTLTKCDAGESQDRNLGHHGTKPARGKKYKKQTKPEQKLRGTHPYNEKTLF